MKSMIGLLAMVAFILAQPLGLSAGVFAQQPKDEVIRIGYLESEPYKEFTFQLTGMVQGIENLGYLSDLPDLSGEEDAAVVWQALCENQTGETVQFMPEAFYSLLEMDETQRAALVENDEIDLFVVMGTVAGVFLTQSDSTADYMVFASGDPISAGIVKSKTERLSDRSFAHIDQTRYVRQIQAAYNLFRFSDIGVVYQDTPEAYSYSGIAQLEEAAYRFGFNIHTLHVDEPASLEDYDRYYTQLKDAYTKLLPSIDALYITTASIEDEKLPWLLEDVHREGVYSIAQSSEQQVAYGALMNVSISNPQEEGLFAAQCIHEYVEGTPLNDLNPIFETTPKLTINFNTARALRLQIPFQSLLIFDTIYNTEGISQ